MKKLFTTTFIISTLFLSSVNADTDWYVGVETGLTLSQLKEKETGSINHNYIDAKLKVGKGLGSGSYFSFYYLQGKYSDEIEIYKNDRVHELGFEFMEQFELDRVLYPFIKVGVGVAKMNLEREISDNGANFTSTNSSVLAPSFTAGIGVDIKASKSVSVICGYDFNYRKWQDIDYSNSTHDITFKTSQKTSRFYIGANYRF